MPADNGAGDDDVDSGVATPDGPDGTGCTTLTPRTQDPEPFIGPTGLEARLGAMIDGATTSLEIQMYLLDRAPVWRTRSSPRRTAASRSAIILDPDEAGNSSVEPMFTSRRHRLEERVDALHVLAREVPRHRSRDRP